MKDMNNKNGEKATPEKAVLRRTVMGEDGNTYEVEETLDMLTIPDDLETLKQMLKKDK